MEKTEEGLQQEAGLRQSSCCPGNERGQQVLREAEPGGGKGRTVRASWKRWKDSLVRSAAAQVAGAGGAGDALNGQK